MDLHDEIRQAILYLRGATKKKPTMAAMRAVVETHEGDCWVLTLKALPDGRHTMVKETVQLVGRPCFFCLGHAFSVGTEVQTKRRAEGYRPPPLWGGP